jgi:hypothetical protein
VSGFKGPEDGKAMPGIGRGKVEGSVKVIHLVGKVEKSGSGGGGGDDGGRGDCGLGTRSVVVVDVALTDEESSWKTALRVLLAGLLVVRDDHPAVEAIRTNTAGRLRTISTNWGIFFLPLDWVES